MTQISANDLKTKGISAIESALAEQPKGHGFRAVVIALS